MKNNPYRLLGAGLIIMGVIIGPVAYFLMNSIPITAIALSSTMIGFTSSALATTRPRISPEASRMMLETGMRNIVSLLEELGINNRAVYLPSSMRVGAAQVLIPLNGDVNLKSTKAKLPDNLLIHAGNDPYVLAISIVAPGATILNSLETKSGSTTSEIEQALTYVLTGLLDIASTVSVHQSEKYFNIKVTKPELYYENIPIYRYLGSPIASIVATIVSDGLGKPLIIKEESYKKAVSTIQLEVLD